MWPAIKAYVASCEEWMASGEIVVREKELVMMMQSTGADSEGFLTVVTQIVEWRKCSVCLGQTTIEDKSFSASVEKIGNGFG